MSKFTFKCAIEKPFDIEIFLCLERVEEKNYPRYTTPESIMESEV
jgi:hypothetical protein